MREDALKLTLKDHPSADDAIRRMTARLDPSERVDVREDLAGLAAGSSLKAYVEAIFELEEDDLAALLFRTMQQLASLGPARSVIRRRIRILWYLWCERFDSDESLLAYLRERLPAEAGPIRRPTDFLTEELRELLLPPDGAGTHTGA